MPAYRALERQNRCRRRRYFCKPDSLPHPLACCPGKDSNLDRTQVGFPRPHSPPGPAKDAGFDAEKQAPILASRDSVAGGDGRPDPLVSSAVTLPQTEIVVTEWNQHFAL